MRKLLILFLLALSSNLQAQEDLLLSGPMVGYCEMREALLWVQTNGPAVVQFEYWRVDEPDKVMKTIAYQTNAPEAFTARIVAVQVQPGNTYNYRLLINNQEVKRPYPLRFKTPPLWQFRTDPPAMKIALGSCLFINDEKYDRPGKGYGGDYSILERMQEMEPDIMLWLGDNTYLREPDWFTRTGIIHRYTHTRQIKEMQPLLASAANYAVWDDHDYGPNDSDWTFRNKDLTLEAFRLFWGNPTYGLRNGLTNEGGITSSFQWGDADFFIVDNRWFRTPNNKTTEVRTVLGETQLRWLVDALVSSKATFKFVMIGGQVVNSADVYENYANLAPMERNFILNSIASEGIKNVVFLSGDRHHSELSMVEKNGIKIYDFTASPLTSGSHDASDEPNRYRVKDSHVGIRNFGMMEITGPRLERKVVFTFYDTAGQKLWSHEILADHSR
ncbi:MAG: alkaline phosphatase D family protein [Bacteroidota bacterium]